MKTLVFYLVLMLLGGIANAQEITELKETKLEFAPFSSEVKRSGNNFTFKVREKYVGEFEKDPLLFLDNNFNVKQLLHEVKDEGIQIYGVTLNSSRGSLEAEFSSNGELVKSTSKFKNILLPGELRHQLYRDHKGWTMVKNVHVTRGKMGVAQKEFYRIKLENGKQRKNVTFEAPENVVAVAEN